MLVVVVVVIVVVVLLSYDDDRYLIRRNFGEWRVGFVCECVMGNLALSARTHTPDRDASHTLALGS